MKMWRVDERVTVDNNEEVVTVDCGHYEPASFDEVIILRTNDPEIRYFCCVNCYRLVFARMIEDLRTVTMKIK